MYDDVDSCELSGQGVSTKDRLRQHIFQCQKKPDRKASASAEKIVSRADPDEAVRVFMVAKKENAVRRFLGTKSDLVDTFNPPRFAAEAKEPGLV